MGQTTDLGGADERPTTSPSVPMTRAELRRAAEAERLRQAAQVPARRGEGASISSAPAPGQDPRPAPPADSTPPATRPPASPAATTPTDPSVPEATDQAPVWAPVHGSPGPEPRTSPKPPPTRPAAPVATSGPDETSPPGPATSAPTATSVVSPGLDEPAAARRSPALAWLWSIAVAVVAWGVSMPKELGLPIGVLLAPGIVVTIAAALIDRRALRARGHPSAPWAVLAFLVFCGLSVAWSVDPQDTIMMTALYAGIAALAALLVWWTDARTFLRGLVLALVAVAGTTLWAVAMDRPKAIVTTLEVGAAYTGLYGNRNVLAYTVVLLLPALLAYRFRLRYVALGVKVACVAGVVVLMYLSRSSTGKVAVAVLLAAAVVVWALRFVRPRVRLVLAGSALGLAVVAATVGLLNRASLAAALNKDATFSGRTLLWKKIIAVTEDRPFGGYGWGTVWNYHWYGQDGSAAYNRITRRLEKSYAHGHNGVFDVLPQVGVVGTALMLAIVAVAFVGTLRALVSVPSGSTTTAPAEGTVFATLALTAVVVLVVTEPVLTIPLGWFVLVALATFTSRTGRDRREQHPGSGWLRRRLDR